MITGIILASGLSRRMRKEKLLLDLGDKPIIEYAIEACKISDLDRVILVYRSEEVKLIAKKYEVDTIYNENARLGQSEAIRLGLSIVEANSSFMFLMGDQPFIDRNLINILIAEYKKSNLPIVVPFYNGAIGLPNIFGSEYREELLGVEGDIGGREIIKRDLFKVQRIDIADSKIGIDIDTIEDLENARKLIK